ncbi:AlpA family phage regulatory protein [Serratia fonticola]|nr:AlpA family phage regulatory protein [Serratia fonticola]
MKAALSKEKLLQVVPLSWSTIEALEKAGDFPERFKLTEQRVGWNQDEVEHWLDERQKNCDGKRVKNTPRENMRRKQEREHAA